MNFGDLRLKYVLPSAGVVFTLYSIDFFLVIPVWGIGQPVMIMMMMIANLFDSMKGNYTRGYPYQGHLPQLNVIDSQF